MSYVFNAKLDWIGFGYTPPEKQQMELLSKQVKGKEFVIFTLINTILFISIAALLIVFGMFPILESVYPTPQAMKNTSALFFLSLLGLVCVLMLSVGFPLCIALAGSFTNLFFKKSVTPLPTSQSNQLYRKVLWQFFRMGLILTVISMALAFWDIRLNGKISVIVGPIARILGPFTSIATLLYVFGLRQGKQTAE